MPRRIAVIAFALMSLSLQAQDQDCLLPDEAVAKHNDVQCLFIDCRNDDCATFLNSLDDFPELRRIEIYNLDKDYFAKDLSYLKNLESVTIAQSPGLNFTGLFRKLATLPAFSELVLDNNGLKVMPKTLLLAQGIDRLVIRNNETFEVEKSILVICHLPKLKELAIPVNQIVDLPENINLLKNLEILDLSDNQLTDLPKQMGELDSLEVLNIEKNVFINPVKSLEKLKGLNIKYLSVDVCLSSKDKEKLSRIFPRAEIVEVPDTVDRNDDMVDFSGADSLMWMDTTEVEYNNIIIDGGSFHALSDAYLHYAGVFEHPNLKNTFDSLLFEERYLDVTYSNVWKIQPWRDYNNIRLYLFKGGAKGEIWFDFHLDYKKKGVPMADPWITKNNPELLAFLGMKWVYQGDLSLNQFKSKYIKNINGYRYWMDVRVFYNEKEKNFIIELKDRHGFTQIKAYLRNRSQLVSLEKAQESYAYYFERYMKALDGRRKRFHKKLLKDKSAYDMTLQRARVSAWEGFRRVYMSPEEQKMSMKVWLEYYDRVIADEPAALKNAIPGAGLFERSLQINAYANANNSPLSSDTSITKGVYAMFRDDQGAMVIVTKVIAINLTEKSYRTFEGSLGLKNIRMYFNPGARYAIIAQIRNGDIGTIGQDDFMQIALIQNKEYILTLNRMPGKISTIGQIQNLVGY